MEGNVKGFMMHNQDEQDQLPLELQQALHFSSGSEADSSAVLKAPSNNSKNSCSDSLTSSSPQSELLALNLDISSHPHHHHQYHYNSDNNNSSSRSMQQLLADDCSSTHFLLPRTAWPTPSCSSSIEEPTFTSSSPSSYSHGLSLSNSMAKTIAASQPVAFPSTHPDMQHAAANRLPCSHASNIQFAQDQYAMHNHAYPHAVQPAADPDIFSSFFNPVYMQQHADSAHDCDMYLQADVDPYHNSHQTHHNFFQHDGHAEEEPYSQGTMIPIQAQAYAHMGDHHNTQGGEHPTLHHSQSLPIYLDHMGHHSFEFWEPNNHALLSSDPASARSLQHHHIAPAMSGSMVTNEVDLALRNHDQMLRSSINYKDSCSSVEQDEEECVQGNLWKAREYAPRTPTAAAGITKPSNKRPCPANDVQEGAPPLKRSVSWNCMGSISIAGMMTINNSDINNDPSPKGVPPHNPKPASKAKQGGANDPQSIAARHRRERISERLKILQQLVPNGSKVDLVTMLEKAINYVKFLQLQVKVLATDEYWPTPLNRFPQVALPLNLLDPQVKNRAKDDQTIKAESNSSDSKVEA